MNVTFSCPHCDQTSRVEFAAEATELPCPHCQQCLPVPSGAIDNGEIKRCLICPSKELFPRKDFSQKLGIGIIILGFVISTITWANHMIYTTFAVLFVSAAVDFVLFFTVKNLLQCYRCHCEYRGVAGIDQFAPFSLETHEKYRQQAARMAEHQHNDFVKTQ